MTVKLEKRVWTKLRAKLKKLDGASVRVGVLASRGGNIEHTDGITMTELAAIHEFGTRNVPERSFIRKTTVEKRQEIAAITTKLAKAILADKTTHKKALDLLGLKVVGMVKGTIREGVEPALKPATIARKGSSKPLVDTGRLLNAIQHEVVS